MLVLGCAPVAHAGQTSVVNSISVSSNTGGSHAQSGEVVTGTSRASLDLTTTIDGEVVEEVHTTSATGTIVYEHTVRASSSSSSVRVNARAEGAASQSISSRVPLSTNGHATGTKTSERSLVGSTSVALTAHAQTGTTSITSTITSNQTSSESELTVGLGYVTSMVSRFVASVTSAIAYVLSTLFSS